MNKRIAALRDVVTKVTKLLAGKGIEVTQRGAQAYVQRDPVTAAPIRVNIPYIADDSSEDFILAIQGFIDHEIGHVLFTDGPLRLAHTGGNERLHMVWNVIEDPMIERLMGKKFPGAAHNIEKLHTYFIAKITAPALAKVKGKNMATFQVLLVPCMRALSGQRVFHEFMLAGGYYAQPLIALLLEKMSPETRARLPGITTTAEALAIADELYAIIFPPPKEVDADDCEKSEDDKDDATTFDTAVIKDPPPKGGSGGEGDGEEESESRGSKGSREEEEAEADDEEVDADAGRADPSDEGRDHPDEDADGSDDTEGADRDGGDGHADEDGLPEGEDLEGEDAGGSEPAGDDASDAGEDPAKATEANDDDATEADEGAGGPKLKSDGAAPGAADGEATDDGHADGEAEPADFEGTPEPEAAEEEEPSPFAEEEADLSKSDFEGALAEHITDAATKDMRREPYRVFTTDFDRIEVYQPTSTDDRRVARMDDAVKHTIAPMQKDLERLMAARSQKLRVPGFRSGRLDASNLHRLSLRDDRVFRRTHEMKTKNTAVSLLVDLSGSMGGGKVKVAAQASYALSLTLDRLAVPHEVLGFTTSMPDREQLQALSEEQNRIGRPFTRWENIYMPIFKQFQERFNPTVKRRFAEMASEVDLSQNIDGECVMMAARRLAMRPEERKILMVFSDGEPLCRSPDTAALGRHLTRVVKNIERDGIETIGIGIMDSSVKNYYPKSVVLRDIASLPKIVMGELKKVLLAA